MMRRRSSNAAAALPLAFLLALALGGCGSLLTSRTPSPVTYVLRPAASAAQPAADAAPSLQVQRVASAPGYARDEILLTQPDRRLDIYASSRWPDTLPVVVERLVVDALRRRGAWSVVHDAAAPYAADRLLRVTVRRFDAEYPAAGRPPTVRVVFDATLARRGERTVVAAFSVEGSAVASEDRMSAIVAAFEQASGEALAALAERAAQGR